MAMLPRYSSRVFFVGTIIASLSVLSTPATSQERFDGQTLRVATFGAIWKDTVDELVASKIRELGAKVEFVAGEPKDSLSKLILSRGRAPDFDLVEVDTGTFNPIVEGGFLEEFDTSAVPNVSELTVPVVTGRLVPIYFSQEGIIYNAKKFKEAGLAPPERYSDVLTSKLKGYVAFPDINLASAVFALVGLAYDNGGDENNIEPALKAVKEYGWPSYAQSTTAEAASFKAGDIWCFFSHVGWATRLRKAGMQEISFAHPKIGEHKGIANVGYFGLTKGSKNSKLASAFVGAFISADVQEQLALKTGIVPANGVAQKRLANDPVLNEIMILDPKDVKNMYTLNMQKVSIPKWTDMWNREVVR
jgi:spermidine/putrescine-binding protein